MSAGQRHYNESEKQQIENATQILRVFRNPQDLQRLRNPGAFPEARHLPGFREKIGRYGSGVIVTCSTLAASAYGICVTICTTPPSAGPVFGPACRGAWLEPKPMG